MKKISIMCICFSLLCSIISCSKTPSNYCYNDETSYSLEDDDTSYTLKYDMFIEKIDQIIGTKEMFTSIDKISTHKSYDNNYNDLFTLTSMLFEKEYMVSVIYEGNSIKSIDIYGKRDLLGENQYSIDPDYIVLTSTIYQILNEQPDAYGIMVTNFDMTCQDAIITKTMSSDNWIMIYSANNENISFFFQIK